MVHVPSAMYKVLYKIRSTCWTAAPVLSGRYLRTVDHRSSAQGRCCHARQHPVCFETRQLCDAEIRSWRWFASVQSMSTRVQRPLVCIAERHKRGVNDWSKPDDAATVVARALASSGSDGPWIGCSQNALTCGDLCAKMFTSAWPKIRSDMSETPLVCLKSLKMELCDHKVSRGLRGICIQLHVPFRDRHAPPECEELSSTGFLPPIFSR